MKKFLLLLFAVSMLNACKIGSDDGNPIETYDFQVDVAVANPQAEYQVGDTLWMDINIPDKTLTDRKTGKNILLDGTQFGVHLLPLNFFDSEDSTLLFHERFDIVASRAFERPNADYPAEAAFTFGCPDNVYRLKIGVVFKDKGHFLFLLNQSFGSMLATEPPRTQVFLSANGDCNSPDINNTDTGFVEYVFAAADYNQPAFEAFMNALITDPHNWDPESTQQSFEILKSIFDNKGAYFAVVK